VDLEFVPDSEFVSLLGPVQDSSGIITGISYNVIVRSINWRLETHNDFVRRIFSTLGIEVAAGNIEVSEDGSRAYAPTWTLMVTDDAYYINVTAAGNAHIRRR